MVLKVIVLLNVSTELVGHSQATFSINPVGYSIFSILHSGRKFLISLKGGSFDEEANKSLT